MFSKCLFITMSKRTCFIFQSIFPHFFRYICWREGSETDIVHSSDSVRHLIYRFFDDTSLRSSATTLLVELGLFSSLRRSKSVTTCSSIFCPLTRSAEMSPLDFTATVKWSLACFLTWLATSSSLVFASFAFLRLLEPLG